MPRSMLRRILDLNCILIAILLGGVLARAAGWSEVKSQHFTVVGSATEAELRSAADRLEVTRDAVSQSLGSLRADGRPLTVVVFADAREYRSFKPLRSNGSADDAVLGYYTAGEDHDLITVSAGPKVISDASLSHEYLHWLLRSNYPAAKLPPWLDEGLAEYFANLEAQPDGAVNIGRERGERLAILRKGTLIDPTTFFSLNPLALKGSDAERARFYSQSWVAAHWLVTTSSGPDKLRQLMDAVAGGSSADAALSKSYGVTAVQLVADLSEYMARPLVSSEVSVARPKPAGAARALSPAATDAILGDLLAQLGREPEAETFLRRAVATVGAPAQAHTAFGAFLARRGGFTEAIKELETAISLGETGSSVNFYYAYSLSHGGQIGSMDEHSLDLMRASLDRSLSVRPDHVPSMQLLAGLDLQTENNLPEAETLLRKAWALRPADEQVQVMLAKVLLRRERYSDATELASKLAASDDAQVRKDAAEILDVGAEYRKASVNIEVGGKPNISWDQPIIFLKRSWLSTDELSGIEKERNNSNLNVALGMPHAGEVRVLGALSKITCDGGRIDYQAVVEGRSMALTSASFERVRMSVLLEGSHTFRLDCGADLSKDTAVLTYTAVSAPGTTPQLRAIAFVPADLRLLTPQQLSHRRMVVVEDDRLSREPDGTFTRGSDLAPDERLKAIAAELRPPGTGERRVLTTLTKLSCDDGGIQTVVDADGKSLRLYQERPERVKVRWFTPATAQASLLCDEETSIANALITYVPLDETAGEVRAIEFVPAGFRLPDIRR